MSTKHPNTRLWDAMNKYPPDFVEMEKAVLDGANINYGKEDGDNSLLSGLFQHYLFYKTDGDYFDKDFLKKAHSEGRDGRYLPQIVKFFLRNGYNASIYGPMDLACLAYSSFDHYAIECAALLIDAGADVSGMPDEYDPETVVECAWDVMRLLTDYGQLGEYCAEAIEASRNLARYYEDRLNEKTKQNDKDEENL